jgi:hypothetical protein
MKPVKKKRIYWTRRGDWKHHRACHARRLLPMQDLVVEIPRYTINHASENH